MLSEYIALLKDTSVEQVLPDSEHELLPKQKHSLYASVMILSVCCDIRLLPLAKSNKHQQAATQKSVELILIWCFELPAS